jgi:hypothetical protein
MPALRKIRPKAKVISEATIEKTVCNYAKQHGWLTFKWASMYQKGLPDRLFFRGGQLVLIEFKQVLGKLTPMQHFIHQQLETQGFAVNVIKSIEAGKHLIDKYTN